MKDKECFLSYVQQFDQSDTKIALKLAHSFRVSDLCEEIAVRLGFSQEDCLLAKRIGLLHDIGRFPQAALYGTFVDAKSVPHAQLSIQVLFEEGWIQRFINDQQQEHVIKQAIRFHSDRCLPVGLDPKEEQFCHLLRDADKIDIIHVHQNHSYQDFLDCSKEEMADSSISDAVLDAFLQQVTVDFTKRTTPLDILLSHDAIVFGLHYEESRQLFSEKGYSLLRIIEGLDFTNKETRKRLQIIAEACRRAGFMIKETI